MAEWMKDAEEMKVEKVRGHEHSDYALMRLLPIR